MSNSAMIGLVGGIVGGVLGLLGGIYGTYRSYRAASGPKEKSFVLTTAMFILLGVSLYVALVFITPQTYRWMLAIPYGLSLGLGIIWANRKHMAIRAEESKSK
jgi:hypothetical protein